MGSFSLGAHNIVPIPKVLAITVTVKLLSIHHFRLPEHAGASFEGSYRPETSEGMRPTAPGPNIAGRPLRPEGQAGTYSAPTVKMLFFRHTVTFRLPGSRQGAGLVRVSRPGGHPAPKSQGGRGEASLYAAMPSNSSPTNLKSTPAGPPARARSDFGDPPPAGPAASPDPCYQRAPQVPPGPADARLEARSRRRLRTALFSGPVFY